MLKITKWLGHTSHTLHTHTPEIGGRFSWRHADIIRLFRFYYNRLIEACESQSSPTQLHARTKRTHTHQCTKRILASTGTSNYPHRGVYWYSSNPIWISTKSTFDRKPVNNLRVACKFISASQLTVFNAHTDDYTCERRRHRHYIQWLYFQL